MTLNPTNLRDLTYICQIARDALQPEEDGWRLRINHYQQQFQAELDRLKDVTIPIFPELDPAREGYPFSGILVRARLPDGKFDSVDIAHLTRQSLFAWLRSRSGENLWAENTVMQLLGYEVD